jgi:hypothetical protein
VSSFESKSRLGLSSAIRLAFLKCGDRAFTRRGGFLQKQGDHLPALLPRAGGVVETPPAGGLPVGMLEDERASRGDARRRSPLPLYDGVSETSDANQIELGEQRLLDLLSQGDAATGARWVAQVECAMRDFARGKRSSTTLPVSHCDGGPGSAAQGDASSG